MSVAVLGSAGSSSAQVQQALVQAAAPAPAAPTPQQVKAGIIEKGSEAIIAGIAKIFATEVDEMAKYSQTHGRNADGAKAFQVSDTLCFGMRPAHLITTYSRADLESDIKGLNGSQTNCYNAILAKCVTKITQLDKHLVLGLQMAMCEPEIQEGTDYSKSKILRSRVVNVTLTVKGNNLAVFS
jgi:hypothetical protein